MRGRWKFFDGEQRSLGTVGLRPRDCKVGKRRNTVEKKKVWYGRQ